MFIISEELLNIATNRDLDAWKEIIFKRELSLSNQEVKVLKIIKKKITEIIKENIFIIYGSRARGDFREDSDYDICILVPNLNRELQEQIFTIIWEEGFEHDMLFQAVYFTYDDFLLEDTYKTRHVQSIIKEGVGIDERV